MEGKKVSSFIKRKSTLGGLTAGSTGSLTGSTTSTSQTGSGVGSLTSVDSLTAEEFQKRNTRNQIPNILLEDEIEKEEDYPFDFEKYYYESKDIIREVNRELVIIPDDNTQNQIERSQRENRMSELPKDYLEDKLQHVDDCIQFYFTNSWKSLKSIDYYKDETPKSVYTRLEELKMEYRPTSSLYQLLNGLSPPSTINITEEADRLHMHYLERHLRKEMTTGSDLDPGAPKSLFSYFTLSEPTEAPLPAVPYQKEQSKIISVTCKELSFKFWEKDEDYEPFFCSMYLFDTKRKIRLSETFHFDFNNEKSLKLISGPQNATATPNLVSQNSHSVMSNLQNSNDVNKTKNAIFRVTPARGLELDNVYLVMKIDKVLLGDLDDQSEAYIKPPSKDKEKDKLKESIRSNCSRLGLYRQSFAWGCIPLFEDGVGEDTIIRPLYKSRVDLPDSQLFDTSKSENSKSASTKKMKVIPGECVLDIKELTEADLKAMYLVNPSLVPLSSTPLPITPSPNTTPSSTPATSPCVSPVMSPKMASNSTSALFQDMPALDQVFREIQEFYPTVTKGDPNPPQGTIQTSIRTQVNLEFSNNLYIYPESLNFSNRSGSIAARNITCKIQLMECDDNIHFDGLKLIYGKSRADNFVSKVYTSVTYHSKTPIFNEEIKIRLPINLPPNLHLLFTFYHITCQKSSDKSENQFDQPVGHAVLPLLQNGKIIGDECFSLPVGYEFPPRYMKPETESLIRYIDNKKPVFQVRTKLQSTIYSTDDTLNNFFNHLSAFHEQLSADKDAPINTSGLVKSIKSLDSVRIDCIIQFFPVILNQLFRLMTIVKVSSELSVVCFMVIADLLSIVNGVTNNSIIESYWKYVFGNFSSSEDEDAHFPVYEVMVKTWLEILRFQEQQNSENILRFSSFFFNIIFKSMSLSLIERSKREENKTRKSRFLGIRNFLAKLIYILRWETVTRVKYTFKLSKELIRSLGNFVSSLLSIVDRGFVFKIIERVVSDFDNPSENENEIELNELKFEFLRIICQNDYFVQLNIPLPYRVDTSLKLNAILSTGKHFLSDLLLHHIGQGLSSRFPLVRMDAANSLRDTLIRLDMDHRWQDVNFKQRIVGVFVPYLAIIVNNWHLIKDDSFIMKRNILVSFVYLLKTIHPNLIRIWWKEESKSKYQTFFEILIQCQEIFEFVGKVDMLDKVESSTSIRTSTAKSILEDYYFRGTSPYGSKKMYNNRSLREKLNSRKSILENYNKLSDSNSSLTGSGSILKESASISNSLSASGSSPSSQNSSPGSDNSRMGTLRGEKRMKGTLSPNTKLNLADYDDRLESHLSYEVANVILNITDDFMYEYERDLKTSLYFDILEKIFVLLNSMMKKNQSLSIVPKLYATLRQFIYKFPKTVFEGANNTFCLDLCDAVILHCNSCNQVTREEASAFTYILFRKNYEQTRKNFVRTKTQITIGLSKIIKSISHDFYLQKSLASINTYAQAQADKLGTKSFAKQIEDLTKRLHTFVIDNIKINNHKDDPEMVADLYHRIAENNKSNADTRICWLQGLADFHSTQENYVEAAQCYLHMASLVAEYLVLIGKAIPTILGSQSFLFVNKNSLEESNSYIEREEEGNDNQTFSMEFFMKLVLDAIQLLKKAEYFETANLVYKILIPVYENNLNYEALANCHGDLQDIFKRIVECTKTQSRMLGSYYRVVLYGKAFEDYSGLEFIYKEPKITRLVEIKDRLKSLYAKKLNVPESEIQIVEGSQIDITTKDPQKCYLQITSVLPYFSEDEAFNRRTAFDRSVNLNKFIFETPFTETGPGRANHVADQYKRKTILTTQNHFPYTKKRILVTSKQEIVLSPIENAIEAIEQRTENLTNEAKTQPPNAKTLQILLQGTLRIQVNSGPQEICKTFLIPASASSTSSDVSSTNSGSTEGTPIKTSSNSSLFPVEKINKLKSILSNFLQSCSDAVLLHKSLASADSLYQEFQDEMEQGYLALYELLESYSIIPSEGCYHPSKNQLSATQTLFNSSGSLSSGKRNSGGISLEVTDLSDPNLSSTLQGLQSNTNNRRSFTQRLSNSLKKPVLGLENDEKEN